MAYFEELAAMFLILNFSLVIVLACIAKSFINGSFAAEKAEPEKATEKEKIKDDIETEEEEKGKKCLCFSITSACNDRLNFIMLAFSISKNLCGASLLFVPGAFVKTGLVFGILSLVFVCILSSYSFCLISKIANNKLGNLTDYTYSDIWINNKYPDKYCCPECTTKFLKYSTDFLIAFCALFINVTYTVYIASKVINLAKEEFDYDMNRLILIITISIVLFPVSLVKDLSRYPIFSLLSFSGLLIIPIVTSVYIFKLDLSNVVVRLKPLTIKKGFSCIASFSGNFFCHINTMTHLKRFKKDFKKRDITHFYKIVALGFAMVLFLCVFFGTVAFYTFGIDIKEEALLSYPRDAIIKSFTGLLCLSIAITYVMTVTSLRESIFNLFDAATDHRFSWDFTTNLILTVVVIILTMSVSLLDLKAGDWISILMCTLGSMFIFIFPSSVFFIQKIYNRWGEIFMNIFMLLYGVGFSLVFGLITTIDNIKESNSQ